MSKIYDPERTIEFEFVRATENAALSAMHWIGRGEKELADAAGSRRLIGGQPDARGGFRLARGAPCRAPVRRGAGA